jgi:hypothetical protein
MNERKLTKSELAKREDIIMKMKDNKRALVQKYGKDAEAVMYGRATNLAKKEAKNMDQDKIKELVKDALQNPKKADLNKDGKLSDYEKKRGAAIEKSMVKEWGSSDQSIMNQSIHRDLGEPKEFPGLSQIIFAAESAVDFYWDDWDEYQTDRDGLIMSAAQRYARQYHPEFMAMASKMMEPIDEIDLDLKGGTEKDKDADIAGVVGAESALGLEENLNESKEAGLDELKGIINQASALGEEARNIIEAYFPSYSAQGEAYGAFDFVESSNPYDTTLVTIVEEIEADEDSYEEEDLNEDLDLGHEDDEPHMLKADLYRIGKYAMELYQMVDRFEEGSEEVDFPHWWQSKIIRAKDMLVGAKHYLDFEVKEPQIDAMVDVAQEEDVIDENAIGINDRRLDDKQKSALDLAVRGDNAYTFGNDPYADDQLRYKYARKMGFLEEGLPKELSIAEKLAKQLKSK